MPRHARLDAFGVLQHVMARGIERRKIFLDNRDYRFLKDRLGRLLQDIRIDCLAWAFLPNHFHLLLRTHNTSMATFMRRLMTAYAGYFNRRHHRSGHLFQNRYKSLICEEDPYLLELVRYIHLNPLRSGFVEDLAELEKYPWCGHGAVMGQEEVNWQKSDEVLEFFGEKVRNARLGYERFMLEGIGQGKQPELTGGGFMRRMKGKGKVAYQQRYLEELSDSRVLGSGDFVGRVLRGKQEEMDVPKFKWEELVEGVAKWAGITPFDLCSGSKRPLIAEARSILSFVAVRQMRMRTTEVAGFLNVSQSAISKLVLRGEDTIRENGEIIDQIKRKS